MSVKHKELVHISQDELNKLEGDYAPKCKYCGKSIWYDNTKISYRLDGKLSSEFRGTTYRTIKMMNGIPYNICVCQKCMEKKYPEFVDKNKSKIFNTFNKYASYAFDIPYDDIKMKNKLSAVTLENFIRKYGEEDGKLRFDEYRKKQAYSNSFEYKNKRYGWTNDEFNKFNQSRAVTLENLIKKHGEVEGKKIWDNYLKRQSETSTNEYLIDKFGEEKAKNIMLLKARDINGYILNYGEDEGRRKYNDYVESSKDRKHYSKFSKIFFDELIEKLTDDGIVVKSFYGDNEFWRYSNSNNLYFLDFFIPELNFVIELNGDYWHCNSNNYDENYYHELRNMTAKEIWEHDKTKNDVISNELGYILEVVWENDIRKNRNIIIESLIDKIKKLYVSANKENKKNQ